MYSTKRRNIKRMALYYMEVISEKSYGLVFCVKYICIDVLKECFTV